MVSQLAKVHHIPGRLMYALCLSYQTRQVQMRAQKWSDSDLHGDSAVGSKEVRHQQEVAQVVRHIHVERHPRILLSRCL